MNQTELNIADVNFLIEKIDFFQSLTKKSGELKKYGYDCLYYFPHPSGRGNAIYGREAHNRFHEMGERYLVAQKDKKEKVNSSDFTKELFNEFSKRFLINQQEVNEKNVSRMLSNAYKSIETGFDSLTHLIPCSVVMHDDPPAFNMGPVLFQKTSKFLEENQKKFSLEKKRVAESHKEQCKSAIKNGYPISRVATPKQSDEYAVQLVETTLDYYKNYVWIAEVTIKNCHKEISKLRAKMAVEGALNILKLIIGESHADKMKLGGSSIPPNKKASLIKNSDGHFHFSISNNSNDNFINDNWFDEITKSYEPWLRSLSMGLQTITEPKKENFLSLRIFDSLKWYGEAVSELSPSTKLIKYITAIERMVGTGEKRNLSKLITKRAAILHHWPEEGRSLKDSLAILNKIYDYRSKLLHGTITPLTRPRYLYQV
jgi:hypothetical protein